MAKNTIKIEGASFEATPAQIEAWKKLHGKVFMIEVEGKKCYLKKPDRKTLSAANAVGANDPYLHNEIVLNSCWLGGDEEIKTDFDLFLAAQNELHKMINVKTAELKEL